MTPDAENYHDQPDILEERLSAYLDGMLDADERALLEAHLANCETCQEQLAQLRRVRALMHALPQPTLPRSFLLPVEEASTPATITASPTPPIPLQSAARRQRLARMARAAQWLGTVAAVLGLALLISTAVLGSRGSANSTAATYASDSGGASSPQSPTYNDNQNASPASALPTVVATPTRVAAPEGAPGHGSSKAASGGQAQMGFSQSSPLLELQLGGGALLMVGVLLVVAGWVTRRRHMPPEVSRLG